MLGEIEEDLKAALGIDTEGIFRRNNRFGFPNEGWKPWRMYDGLEILVPGGFNVTIDQNGDTLIHPLGDTSLPPSSRMPNGGYFFDPIMRQGPIDDDHLNPADNLEEHVPIPEDELAYLERRSPEGGRYRPLRRCQSWWNIVWRHCPRAGSRPEEPERYSRHHRMVYFDALPA